MNHDCDNLDAFLDGELAPDETARFVAHRDECPTCREAVDEQRWIDGLLRSGMAVASELPPDSVLESFRTSIKRSRRKNRVLACGLAAAAVLVVAVGWTAMLNRQARDQAVYDAVAVTGEKPSPDPPRATFVGGPDVIVVPIESKYPDVTIVRVYSTYQPEYAAQANLDQSTPGDEFAWPDLNGG